MDLMMYLAVFHLVYHQYPVLLQLNSDIIDSTLNVGTDQQSFVFLFGIATSLEESLFTDHRTYLLSHTNTSFLDCWRYFSPSAVNYVISGRCRCSSENILKQRAWPSASAVLK
jgi:hypothetical protein